MIRSLTLAVPVALMVALSTPAIAQAQPTTPEANFGHHASHCAHTMGFSGEHNPGMHRGLSGWDGMPC